MNRIISLFIFPKCLLPIVFDFFVNCRYKSFIMYKRIIPVFLLLAPLFTIAQNKMTPELLWKLGRVTALGISKDGKYVVYSVSTPDWQANKSSRKSYIIP